ncbi:MAG: hypothetical protein R6X11_03145 [Desulfonatronovibrio sp.]
MNGIRIAGITLILAGIMVLDKGGFTYPKTTHEAVLGQISLSVQDREKFNIPIWAGIGSMVIGGAFLIVVTRKT